MSKSALQEQLIRHSKEAIQIAVRKALQDQLQQMAFTAFEQIMKRLLYKSGYITVQPTGRHHKRGRAPQGGLDLTARSETELSSALTICQIKQYRRVVSRRFVDELRGAMLRLGAEQGLLVTTSKFSRVAHQAANESSVAPVKLLEGEEVLDLLFAHRIGVVRRDGRWQLDQKYLDKLQENAMGTYGSAQSETIIPKTNHRQNQDALELPSEQLKDDGHSLLQAGDRCVPSLQKNFDPRSKPHPPNFDSYVPTRSHAQAADAEAGGEMTWSTHLMAGLSTLWLLQGLPIAEPQNLALAAGATALGSLLPDLDASESKIKHLTVAGMKPFVLPAQVIYHQLGHRSFLHSLLGLLFIGIICLAFIPWSGAYASLALWLGYASHLAMDASTRTGIPLLYPRSKRFHLLPPRLRITTGSLAEEVVFVSLALTVLALLLRNLNTL